MRRQGRTAAGATLLVVAMMVLVGCGGKDAKPADVVAQAADRTLAAKSAQFSVEATATANGRTIAQRGDGVVDFSSHTIDVLFGRPGDGTQASRQQRTIIIGDDIWSTTPPSLVSAPGAKAFIHTTTSARNANPLAQLTQPDDPIRVLVTLKGLQPATVKQVSKTKEKVRGFDTTHFSGDVDLAVVAARDPKAKEQSESLQKLLGTNIVPVDVWVDGDERVRRVRLTLRHINVTPPASQETTTTLAGKPAELLIDLVITNEFATFGTEVKVSPPPADQVSEAAALTG